MKNLRVFLTGHTGFKGSWLLLWLRRLGAEVTGYSLEATERSMYRQLALDDECASIVADIRDRDRLAAALRDATPDVAPSGCPRGKARVTVCRPKRNGSSPPEET